MKTKNRSFLILLGIVLYLSCSVCNNKGHFDITGAWHFYVYRDYGVYLDITYTFVGTEKQGQLDFDEAAGVSGEYTVDDGQIFFRVTAGRGIVWNVHEYNGIFITNDLMKGTLKGEHREMGQVTLAWNGVWNARKVAGRAHRALF